MTKYLPGMTHCKVVTPATQADLDAMDGTIAFIILCFGEDLDCLQPIKIKKMSGPTTGAIAELPHTEVYNNGKKISVPVFKGKLADEIKMAALIAFDKVKSQYGLKFGKAYKVFAKNVEEIVK